MTEPEYFDLLDRIVKGAEYIEKLPEGDPKLKAAHAKYDQLCEQARAYQAKAYNAKEAGNQPCESGSGGEQPNGHHD